MIIAITGTPGVGKTTVSKLLAQRLGHEYVNLRSYAIEKGIGEMKGDELEVEVADSGFQAGFAASR